jgi:hypothetical protein
MNTNAAFDLDSLLDGTLDDLADLPEFRPYVPGTHRVNFTIEPDQKEKTVYFAKLSLLETMEQVNPDDKPLEVGCEAKIRYDLTNQYAQGNFKKLLTALAAHFGAKSNRELIAEASSPIECLVVTKLVENKKKPGNFYTDVVELQVI